MSKPAFSKSVDDLESGLGLTKVEAIRTVERHYKSFKSRNDLLIERQDSAANLASTNLGNQSTLLAAAVVTFSGAFVGVVKENLTYEQVGIFSIILLCELIALTFAVLDFRNTIQFHNRWAKTYNKINADIESKIIDGTMQETSQISVVANKHIQNMPQETNHQIIFWTGYLAVAGAWMFLVLLLTYFFDVPFYVAHNLT